MLMMMTPEEFAICVSAYWNDARVAHARLGDLIDVHWHQPKAAPHPMLHGYLTRPAVYWDDACQPTRSSLPPGVRVCVPQEHNNPGAYAELERKANIGRSTSCRPSSA
jgi:hypothetical protein